MSEKSDWIVQLSGKSYATWPYVLDEAHKRGLYGIDTELVQIPSADNGFVAIVKATAHFVNETGGLHFSALGDASPESVGNRRIAPHIIRMAETRAKGRALRDACNIGMTLAEELGDPADVIPANPRPKGNGHASPPPPAPPSYTCFQCGAPVEPKVAQIAIQRWDKPYCVEHGKELAQIERVSGRIPTGEVVG